MQAEQVTVPEYSYAKADFLTTAPYDKLFELHDLPFLYEQAKVKLEENALAVGFRQFKKMLNQYVKMEMESRRQNLIPNSTEFDGQFMELNCGVWEATDVGIFRDTPNGGRECACAHPIMPVRRLVNIDTNEVKLTLAFRPPGQNKRWRTTIVDKATVSTSRTITQLASQGISVTSNSAGALVDYLSDMENLNYDIIPEAKSIGRLGYIDGEGFSPYVDELVFDGDESFRNLYASVRSNGDEMAWYQTALECRRMSITARIMLAASFASPLLSIVGALPFFVHLWGVDSGTGKTVALMLAASVWGNPALGNLTQTFNGTQVGQERTAAFLNHLPMCLDELQLTKNSKGQTNFDVYQLAQGVGRARGRKTGGLEKTPTWDCCFLTTGESPLTSLSSGAGAVNRVIDIECTSGTVAISDGHRISSMLKQNYGFAGEKFVENLYSDEKVKDEIRSLYQDYFAELCAGDSTEKQAMAAAAILTADFAATAWYFKDDQALTVGEIREFLASKEAVSAGNRAYEFICGWVAKNANKFYDDASEETPKGDVYGKIEDGFAWIISTEFDRAMQEAGYSTAATKSYLKSNNLLLLRGDGRGSTVRKRICKTMNPSCVVVKLPLDDEFEDDDDILPL